MSDTISQNSLYKSSTPPTTTLCFGVSTVVGRTIPFKVTRKIFAFLSASSAPSTVQK